MSFRRFCEWVHFQKIKKNEYISTDKLTERVGDIYISFIFQKEVFGWIKETFLT